MRLEVGETGQAKNLELGDTFRLVDGDDKRDHVVTDDHGSHFEYDGRPNKRLSKDTLVRRVGKPNEGESKDRLLNLYDASCRNLEKDGNVQAWLVALNDVISRAVSLGMDDAMPSFDKLERVSTAIFSRAKGKRGKLALDLLDTNDRKTWTSIKNATRQLIEDHLVVESLRAIVRTLIVNGRD